MTVTVMTHENWLKALGTAKPRRGKPVPAPNGMSPGGAGAKLGISRHAIYMAIREGRMDAIAVPILTGGRYWIITEEALEAYKRDHLRFEPPE